MIRARQPQWLLAALVAALLAAVAIVLVLLGERRVVDPLATSQQRTESAELEATPASRGYESGGVPSRHRLDSDPGSAGLANRSGVILTGQVFGANGALLDDVDVFFVDEWVEELVASTSQGTYRCSLRSNSWPPDFVVLRRSGHVPVVVNVRMARVRDEGRPWQEDSLPNGDLRIRLDAVLHAGVGLPVRVEWDDGSPCVGARVEVGVHGESHRDLSAVYWNGVLPRTTDEEGRCEFEGVRQDALAEVIVHPKGLGEWQRRIVSVSSGSECLVSVPRPGSLDVQVHGFADIPLSPNVASIGARVATAPRRSASTVHLDTDGHARLVKLRSGQEHELSLFLPGFKPILLLSDYVPDGPAASRAFFLGDLELAPSPTSEARTSWSVGFVLQQADGTPLKVQPYEVHGIDVFSVSVDAVSADGVASRALLPESSNEIRGHIEIEGLPPATVTVAIDGRPLGTELLVQPGDVLPIRVGDHAKEVQRVAVQFRGEGEDGGCGPPRALCARVA